MSATETSLCTIRTPDGLFTLSVQERDCFDFETAAPDELALLKEQDNPYIIIKTPLNAQAEKLTDAQKRLLSDWDALRAVQSPNATLSACLHTVLCETIPEVSPVSSLPILPWEGDTRPLRPVATAAHPRAYQGTKYKPPQTKAPAAVDLRLHLCDAAGLNRLSARWHDRAAGQTMPWVVSKYEMALPQPFRLFLWPSLSFLGREETERFLTLYWELSLERQPQLLAAVALLLKRQPTENTRHWCQIILQQPKEGRLTFAALLLASGAYSVEAATLAPSVLSLFWEVQNGPCPVYRLFWLLRSLGNGLDADYLAAGFRLADQENLNFRFQRVERSGYFPEQTALTLSQHLQQSLRYSHCSALLIWEHCGELPGLGDVLEQVQWTEYAVDVAHDYYYLYVNCKHTDLSPDEHLKQWTCIRGYVGKIESCLQSVPTDYRAKGVAHIRDLMWFFETPQEIQRSMPSAFRLLQRLCRQPYKLVCDTTYVTSDFIAFLPDEAVSRFLAAPETSFLRLEEACHLENNARLIGGGTWSLTRRLPEFSLECFLHYPAKLFKVAKRLGGLPEEIRERIVHEFGLSPLMEKDLLTKGLVDANRIIQRHRQDGVFNPVPKKLQEHLAGRKALRDAQIAMYREQMRRQLVLTRLEMLDRAAWSALQGHFDADPSEPNVGHALTMVHSADENRRAFRKFLAAHWGGDDDYRMRHPLTQAWLKKHPQIDVGTWQKGIVLQCECAAHGVLTLAVEQEPLEALKLGTYVGSCLGLGGRFAYSAVATMLDINKQVVYARDAKGNVVARQLLALSENDQLVCYSVYPGSTAPAVQKLFLDYNRRFAEVMNVSLYSADSDAEYEIDTVLSHGWWDDWVWDFRVDGETNRESAALSG